MEVITPLTKLLLSVKTDALLVFLNTINAGWSLWRREDGTFRAEIRLGDGLYAGSHSHIPHNALARAVAQCLAAEQYDFHTYQETPE